MSIWDIIAHRRDELLRYAAHRFEFRLPTDPAPAAWQEIVARNVPLAHGLPAGDRDLLLRVARLLLEKVPLEGVAGLVPTEEMRVTIAATAALLVYRLPYPRFTKLVRVLVYPDTFVPRQAGSPGAAMVTAPEPSLGEAWMSGVVILSWDAVRRDSAEPARGRNVVIHEMAHILDAEDGLLDGTPLFDRPAQGAEWARVLEREFDRERDAVDAGEDPPLDDYAVRNHAEFFAVATEAFYCSPDRLRAKLPALYEQLQRFYRPAAGDATGRAAP